MVKKLPLITFIKLRRYDNIFISLNEIEHWKRINFGEKITQLFLHYNEKGGKYDIAPNDGRLSVR